MRTPCDGQCWGCVPMGPWEDWGVEMGRERWVLGARAVGASQPNCVPKATFLAGHAMAFHGSAAGIPPGASCRALQCKCAGWAPQWLAQGSHRVTGLSPCLVAAAELSACQSLCENQSPNEEAPHVCGGCQSVVWGGWRSPDGRGEGAAWPHALLAPCSR